MTTEILVNLTLPIVVRDIESVLETYGHSAYRRAFAIPEMRQKLAAYVLSHIPNRYAVVAEDKNEARLNAIPTSPFSERSRVQQVICDGVECVLRDHAEQIEHQLPVEGNLNTAPSHWFG
ncbi:MAG: hypothetical protein AAFY57_19535 [Cyanobacteria bacterium J06642_2]